jgi:hypothetical protein
MMDEWLNTHIIQDLEYLDLGCSENGTWHARVTARSAGVDYRGCGIGPTRDMAKENASNAVLASLDQGQRERHPNGPSSQGSPPPSAPGPSEPPMNPSVTILCEDCSNNPEGKTVNQRATLEELADLKAKVAEFRARNAVLKEHLEEERKVFLAMRNENEEKATKITELQQKVTSQENILRNYYVNSTKHFDRIGRSTRNMDMAEESTIHSLEAKVVDLIAQLEECRTKQKESEGAVQKVHPDQDRLFVQKLRETNERLEATNANLTQELETSRQVAAVIDQMDTPCFKCADLEEKLELIRQSYDEDVEELEAARVQKNEQFAMHEAYFHAQDQEQQLEIWRLKDVIMQRDKQILRQEVKYRNELRDQFHEKLGLMAENIQKNKQIVRHKVAIGCKSGEPRTRDFEIDRLKAEIRELSTQRDELQEVESSNEDNWSAEKMEVWEERELRTERGELLEIEGVNSEDWSVEVEKDLDAVYYDEDIND